MWGWSGVVEAGLEVGMLMRGATTLGNTHSCTSPSSVHCANPPPDCSTGRPKAAVAAPTLHITASH